MMLDSPDFVALHLAIMATGAVAVALSTRITADDLRQSLSVIQPFAVVVDGEFAEVASKGVGTAAPQAKLILRGRDISPWKLLPETELAASPREPTSSAFWLMTSGTTGQPKAIEHRHGAVLTCSDYVEQALGATHADRFLSTSRLNFGFALGMLFGALRIGATAILIDRWPTAPSIAAAANRHLPTIMFSVPAMYYQLALEAPLLETAGFRAVRHYVSSGERLPAEVLMAWQEKFGRQILDAFGFSELVYPVIGNRPACHRAGSSGQPLPGVEARLVDERGTVIAEAGRSGRLEVRMSSLCAGYRVAGAKAGDPAERPAERFKDGGWFAPGDQFQKDDDGFYYHLGRSDDMLKIAGLWVSPSELEDALAGIPSIAQAVVVAKDNEAGLTEIVLYVVPHRDFEGAAAVAAARERLMQVMPAFKRPRRFEIVTDLPRTTTGKIQRRKLREDDYSTPHPVAK